MNDEDLYEFYECPKCGEACYDGGGYYFVRGGMRIDCTVLDTFSGKLIGKPPKGYKAYPIYGPMVSSVAVSMEFGGNPCNWEETHKCHKCNEEFSFVNSNY